MRAQNDIFQDIIERKDRSIASLSKRNDDMVKELNYTRGINRDLKQLLRKMLLRELHMEKHLSDKETQTEFSTMQSVSTPNQTVGKAALSRERTMQNRQSQTINSAGHTVVSKKLLDMCYSSEAKSTDFEESNTASLWNSEFDTDTSTLRTELFPAERTRRNIRRPISYAETPLNVKIRKNFKFFKFEK